MSQRAPRTWSARDWQAAWDARARLDGARSWGLPPRLPIEDIADIRLDQRGRFAIIVGYAGVHRLDLNTLRSTQIFSDARTERVAVISDDGTQAAVFDQYGPCLHLLNLADGTSRTIEGSAATLRKRMRTVGPRKRAICAGMRLKKRALTVSTDAGPVRLRPMLGEFTTILGAARSADGRLFVAADGRTDPRSDAPTRCLFVFDGAGSPLGTVHLAVRGRGAAMIFMDGQAMTVDALEAAGVTVNMSASSEAERAQARFQPVSRDGRDEVVFGRSAAGFLGRLDVDAPLGARAYGYEDADRTRRALRGQPPLDDGPQHLAEDAALRFRYWTARFDDARTIGIAHQISAGFTALLPWIHDQVRSHAKKGGRKAKQRALQHVRHALGRMSEPQLASTFTGMLDRLTFIERAALLAKVLQCKSAAIVDAAAGDRQALERIIRVAEQGGHLDLTACPSGLAVWAVRRLETLTSVAFAADDAGGACMRALLRTGAKYLHTLDIRRGRLSKKTAFALATHRGLPALQTLRLPPTTPSEAKAALHLSQRLPLTVPGDHRPAIATLLVDRRLNPALRMEILRALSPQDPGPGLRLVCETMPGVHLPALLGGLSLASASIVLEGFDLRASDVQSLSGSTVRGCALDLRAALSVAQAVESGAAPLVMEACEIPPAGQAALYLLAQQGAPPSVTAVNAFLHSAVPTDAEWMAVVERGRIIVPDLVDAGFAALDAAEAARLIRDRPILIEWGLRRREMAIARAVARRLTVVSNGQAVGPLSVTRGTAWAITGVKPPFTCAREPEMAAFTKLLTGQDVLTGDADFDRAARLSGDQRALLVHLDAAGRAAWTHALKAGIEATALGLVGSHPLPGPALLARLLITLSSGPEAVPVWQQLRQRFESEPVSGVRAQLLRCLLDDGDVPPMVRDHVCAQAVADAAEGVRAVAAESVWPRVAGAEDLGVFDGAVLAAVLDRLSGDRRLAAIARIGEVGEEICVGALVEAGSGLFKGRTLRDATQAAIAEITKRIGGLRTGGLSVADGGHGGLSTTDDPTDA